MKRKNGFLAALALVLVLGACIAPAYAYFTTYAQAKGGLPIRIGDETTVEEGLVDMEKSIVITNQEEDSQTVWVRAKATGPKKYPLQYTADPNAWVPGSDGWYYYSEPLAPGKSTEVPFLVRITGVPEKEAIEDGDKFDVIVYYETTPVQYKEDGTTIDPKADWDIVLEMHAEGGE